MVEGKERKEGREGRKGRRDRRERWVLGKHGQGKRWEPGRVVKLNTE